MLLLPNRDHSTLTALQLTLSFHTCQAIFHIWSGRIPLHTPVALPQNPTLGLSDVHRGQFCRNPIIKLNKCIVYIRQFIKPAVIGAPFSSDTVKIMIFKEVGGGRKNGESVDILTSETRILSNMIAEGSDYQSSRTPRNPLTRSNHRDCLCLVIKDVTPDKELPLLRFLYDCYDSHKRCLTRLFVDMTDATNRVKKHQPAAWLEV